MTERRARLALAAILFIGLGIRVGWGLHQPSDEAAFNLLPDQREYLALGSHLLHDGSLWMADARFEQVVYAYRTPGYPLLIACCGGKPVVVRLVQCGLDASSILAIYLLPRHWWPSTRSWFFSADSFFPRRCSRRCSAGGWRCSSSATGRGRPVINC